MSIKREDINGSTPLDVVVRYLKEQNVDKASRTKQDEFEQGYTAGKFYLLDHLESIVNRGEKK